MAADGATVPAAAPSDDESSSEASAEEVIELPPPLPLTASEPLNVTTGAHCFDVQFHPSEPLVLATTIEGAIEVHRFDRVDNVVELTRSLKVHKDSCRTARFMREGGGSADDKVSSALRLASTSADRFAKVTDLEKGTNLWKARMTGAGNVLVPITAQRFAVGDDDGAVRVFDIREKKAVVRWTEHSDYISDLALGSDDFSMCATSGDGTFAVYDIRKQGPKGLVAMSDFQEDELLSLAVVRNGTKVVCGSQSGVLAIFSWGDFGDQKDRIKGHPTSVDAMVKVSEDHLLTGCADGKVRAVSLYNKDLGHGVVGVVAEVGDDSVESLSISACGSFFATASHNQPAVRVWSMEDARRLFAGESEDAVQGLDFDDQRLAAEAAEDAEAADSSDEEPKAKKKKPQKRKKGAAGNDASRKAGRFFGDL